MIKNMIFLFFGMMSMQVIHCQNKFMINGGMSYQITNLNWSIAGNIQGNSPNILSELKFNSVASYGGFIETSYVIKNKLIFSGHYENLKTKAGHGIDTDYGSDNRINIIFNEMFDSDQGNIINWKIAAMCIILEKNRIQLLAGVALNKKNQDFYIIRKDFEELNSTYDANALTTFFSGKLVYKFRKFQFSTISEYGYGYYQAKANWNMIAIFENPVSFRQKARQHVFNLGFGFNCNLYHKLFLDFKASNYIYQSNKGLDWSYFKSGNIIYTQFNGAKQAISVANLGLSYNF